MKRNYLSLSQTRQIYKMTKEQRMRLYRKLIDRTPGRDYPTIYYYTPMIAHAMKVILRIDCPSWRPRSAYRPTNNPTI